MTEGDILVFFQHSRKPISPVLHPPPQHTPLVWWVLHSACIYFSSPFVPPVSLPPLWNCLRTCLLWRCPCPCSQRSSLLTGDLMVHRSHTAGRFHTRPHSSSSVLRRVTWTSNVYLMWPRGFLSPLSVPGPLLSPTSSNFSSRNFLFFLLFCIWSILAHKETTTSASRALLCSASVSILLIFFQIPHTPFHCQCSHCFPILISVPRGLTAFSHLSPKDGHLAGRLRWFLFDTTFMSESCHLITH